MLRVHRGAERNSQADKKGLHGSAQAGNILRKLLPTARSGLVDAGLFTERGEITPHGRRLLAAYETAAKAQRFA